MLRETRQCYVAVMLSLSTLAVLHAEQSVRLGDVAYMQLQYASEMRELQQEIDRNQMARRHVVKEPSVVALEVQKAEAKQRKKRMSAKKTAVNPHSAEQKAKVNAALKEFNAKLPEIHSALKQASSNAALPAIELKPLTADGALASVDGKGGTDKSASQLAVNQMIMQRIQQEMAKADPETRNQMKAVMKAMAEGKPLHMPKNLPPTPRSQIQKGAR
jgi:hypothetical protein